MNCWWFRSGCYVYITGGGWPARSDKSAFVMYMKERNPPVWAHCANFTYVYDISTPCNYGDGIGMVI